MASSYLVNSVKTLERLIALIRMYSDEPVVDAKYSDEDLILMIETSFRNVMFDLNCVSDKPILVRHSLSLANGSELFHLPPNVQEVLWIAKINATTKQPDWWVTPHSKYGFSPIVRFEGRTLRFEPKWQGETATVEIKYVPNGDFLLHYGTAGTVTATTVVLAATPTLGQLDTRENAYVGAVLRIVGATTNGYVQERTITAYDQATRTATLEYAFTDTPATSVIYEVVPDYGRTVEAVVAVDVARELMRIAKNVKSVGLLTASYLEKRRACRMQMARVNSMIAQRWEHETIGSR